MIDLSPPPIPAFPTSHEEPDDYNGHNNSKKTVIDQGMTLRDYFAAKAMQGIYASNTEHDHEDEHIFDAVAEAAYLQADAMLKAREA
jgi:hypothetical protein